MTRMVGKADYVALADFRKALRRYLRFVEDGARGAGLTPQQHQVLLAIKGQSGREWASVGDLADSLQLRHHAAVGLVDRCQAAGLVVRTPDPEDGRSVRVSLPPRGADILERLTRLNLGKIGELMEITRDLDALL